MFGRLAKILTRKRSKSAAPEFSRALSSVSRGALVDVCWELIREIDGSASMIANGWEQRLAVVLAPVCSVRDEPFPPVLEAAFRAVGTNVRTLAGAAASKLDEDLGDVEPMEHLRRVLGNYLDEDQRAAATTAAAPTAEERAHPDYVETRYASPAEIPISERPPGMIYKHPRNTPRLSRPARPVSLCADLELGCERENGHPGKCARELRGIGVVPLPLSDEIRAASSADPAPIPDEDGPTAGETSDPSRTEEPGLASPPAPPKGLESFDGSPRRRVCPHPPCQRDFGHTGGCKPLE